MPRTASERLAAARSAVDRACQLLLSPTPQQMDACSQLIQAAISDLSESPNLEVPSLPAGPQIRPASHPDELHQARLLKASIGRAARLLESAAAFHAGWIRCLGALCAGYTGQGQPAALDRGAHLLARG
jgi:hypothetical protein